MRAKSNSPSPAQRSVQAGARKANSYQYQSIQFINSITETSGGRSEFAGFVTVLFGGQLIMKLTVAIPKTASAILGQHSPMGNSS
jgi:hypothetical protein